VCHANMGKILTRKVKNCKSISLKIIFGELFYIFKIIIFVFENKYNGERESREREREREKERAIKSSTRTSQ